MDTFTVNHTPEFYQQVAASGPGFVAIVSVPDMRLLFVNDFFEQELGCSNSEVSEQEVYFTDFVDKYQHERLKHHLQSVTGVNNRHTPYTIYQLHNRGDSNVRSYYLFVSAIQLTGVDSAFKILMMPDLSQWTLPFTSFETRELFLEHFQSESFGTFEWLADVDKTFWSEGVYRLYEVDIEKKDISRQFAGTFIHPDDKQRVTEVTAEAIKNGSPIDIEFRIITAKGTHKTVHSLGRILRDANGVPLKITGSVRDVTRHRNIESDLNAKVEELYQSNRELEEFAYVASHDLQEPLRKITTFSSRLMERYKDALEGEGLMYLTRMNASADNMRTLINDLLEFSRVTNGQQQYDDTDLNLVVRQVKADLELVIEETGATLHLGPLPTIYAATAQMKQLFTNILGNAIKFRKSDEAPVISITAAETTADEKIKHKLSATMRYHTITIADNGIGFEKEYAQKIFNVFQRLHGKSEYPGSGIGLAVCKRIAEHHGGLIYADSQPGQGATFTLILPEQQTHA